MNVSRRHLMATGLAGIALPQMAFAKNATEITWDDLLPPGVPYSEIIGEGEMNEATENWRPIFDDTATKLNPALDGAYIKMPGYIIPFDAMIAGVTSFVLVPYVGACLHTPSPPANQVVFVKTKTPWSGDNLWDSVWVTGQIQHAIQSNEISDTGYEMVADQMEVYEW
jgi:hypothetical protein